MGDWYVPIKDRGMVACRACGIVYVHAIIYASRYCLFCRATLPPSLPEATP